MYNYSVTPEEVGRAGIRLFLVKMVIPNMLTTEEHQFDPEKWGWKLDGVKLNSIMTDLPAAPETLLKFVCYKCKLTSRNPCGTNLCSC